ncbi:hypothetical protein E2C01_086920 [Portunus trituberculatus]|uniref:Uncharacterized protein n=1 Tax=Portunus trituberculatus TaxID=210409 RepID=A0A5B7JAL8_PORTR|nr:hypothetical protein [Portunus trituberculatus]
MVDRSLYWLLILIQVQENSGKSAKREQKTGRKNKRLTEIPKTPTRPPHPKKKSLRDN